jgi:hypothetical protein
MKLLLGRIDSAFSIAIKPRQPAQVRPGAFQTGIRDAVDPRRSEQSPLACLRLPISDAFLKRRWRAGDLGLTAQKNIREKGAIGVEYEDTKVRI